MENRENPENREKCSSPILNNTSRKSYYVRNENIELPTIYNILQQYLRKNLCLSREILENYYNKVTNMKLHHVKNRWLLLKVRGILEFIMKKRGEFISKIQTGNICIFESYTNSTLTKSELETFYQQLLKQINTKIENKSELVKFLNRLNTNDYDPENRWLVLKIKGLLKYILTKRHDFMKSLSQENITILMEDEPILNENGKVDKKTATTSSDIPLTNDNFITITPDNNQNLLNDTTITGEIPLTNDEFITIEVSNNCNDGKMDIDSEIFQNMGTLPDLHLTNLVEESMILSETSLVFTKQENNECSNDLFDTEAIVFKVPPTPLPTDNEQIITTNIDNNHNTELDCDLTPTITVPELPNRRLTREEIVEKMSSITTMEQTDELLKKTYEDSKKMLNEFVDSFNQLLSTNEFDTNDSEMVDITTVPGKNSQIYDNENSKIIQEVVNRFKIEIKNEPQPIFEDIDLECFGFK